MSNIGFFPPSINKMTGVSLLVYKFKKKRLSELTIDSLIQISKMKRSVIYGEPCLYRLFESHNHIRIKNFMNGISQADPYPHSVPGWLEKAITQRHMEEYGKRAFDVVIIESAFSSNVDETKSDFLAKESAKLALMSGKIVCSKGEQLSAIVDFIQSGNELGGELYNALACVYSHEFCEFFGVDTLFLPKNHGLDYCKGILKESGFRLSTDVGVRASSKANA